MLFQSIPQCICNIILIPIVYPRKQEAAQSTNKYNIQQQRTTEVNSKLDKAQTLVFRICMKNYDSNNKQTNKQKKKLLLLVQVEIIIGICNKYMCVYM